MKWSISIKESFLIKRLKFFFNISVSVTGTPFRSSYPEVFLGKGVLKICSKFTGEHPCRSTIWINLLCNFIGIALWHGCSPVNLRYIFRKSFPMNTSGRLLPNIETQQVTNTAYDNFIVIFCTFYVTLFFLWKR